MAYTFKVGIITISDTRSANVQHSDQSGDSIVNMITDKGYPVVVRKTISDDLDLISKTLIDICDFSGIENEINVSPLIFFCSGKK